MSLKEKRVQRQQMLQALVEVQGKAVNMQQAVPLYTLSTRTPNGHQPQHSYPPAQGEVMEGVDSPGSGEQGGPVKQNMHRGYRPRFRRGPPRPRQPREEGNEEDKNNQGDETQGQQPPQRRYRCNFNYRRRRPGNPKPRDGRDKRSRPTS
ncbi:hypothetical protein CB1_001095078 [Camelus ferus]|nr:hypothetical protein CB1_001095078 [Camelus ferus]